MFDIVGKRPWFYVISGLLILISIVALVIFGLEPGIDFASGSITTLAFEQEVSMDELEQELTTLGYTAELEQNPHGDFLIRTIRLTSSEKAQLKASLTAAFGTLTEKAFEDVDPVIAAETARIAGIAVGISAVGILLYLTWAFHRMPNPLRYGVCAVVALLHDVLLVLGVFSILGAVMGWEINLMFITGVLAVIGYSVNNTVVVFDRIRENLRRGVSANFEVVVNNSLVETLSRSLNTSVTTLLVVLALMLFVGVSIQNFAVVLLVGVVAGTYSSLFIAPHLLVTWEKGRWGGFTRQLPTGS
jgi:preprotein translocase subunit SecF